MSFRKERRPAALAGIVAGEIVVVVLTFVPIDVANISEGLIGLAVNLAVTIVAEAVHRRIAPLPPAGLEAPATVAS